MCLSTYKCTSACGSDNATNNPTLSGISVFIGAARVLYVAIIVINNLYDIYLFKC